MSLKGKKLSEQHKKKISENSAKFWLGKHLPEEMIKKISESKKGKTPWNRGKRFTDEHRKNLSKAAQGKCGDKSNSWMGGITPKHIMIRRSIESRLWREAVFARDNWTCQKTKIRGGVLVAHHIQNFSQYPELRFALDNGITFSKEIHKEFHRKYGIKNNNKEQILEFINN